MYGLQVILFLLWVLFTLPSQPVLSPPIFLPISSFPSPPFFSHYCGFVMLVYCFVEVLELESAVFQLHFLFQDWFQYSGIVEVCTWILVTLASLLKKIIWPFDGECFDSVDQLE